MGDVRAAMDAFDELFDKNIEKIEKYQYDIRHGNTTVSKETYGELLSSLYKNIGETLNNQNNYPEKYQRVCCREKMRALMDMIYDSDKREPVAQDTPSKTLYNARAILLNMKTAKFDIDNPPATKHCMCWAAPDCLHSEWCVCGRAPPTFSLRGEKPDACAACRSSEHERVEDWDVSFPDNVLKKDIEANIEAVKKEKKAAIVFPSSFQRFQRYFVHQVAESYYLPSCSLGEEGKGQRRVYVFLSSLQKELAIARYKEGEDNLAIEVIPSTTSSEGPEGYGPRGRGSERGFERHDDRSRSARGRGGKSESKGSGYYDRASSYEDKGEKSGGYGWKDNKGGGGGDKGWTGKYSKW